MSDREREGEGERVVKHNCMVIMMKEKIIIKINKQVINIM